MTLQHFVDTIVDISIIDEEKKTFGHYPFQLVGINDNEEHIIASLNLGGDIIKCYRFFKKIKDEENTTVFMSVDFPRGYDIEHDFVAIFSYQNGEMDIYAIPYNDKTGERYEVIRESSLLNRIKGDFEFITNL